jgi:hypothetical protein
MNEATERAMPAVIEQRALTAADVRAHVNLIQQVMQGVMKEGTHFGTIPGTKQPTLYKAGSEVLLTTFRIAVDPIVEDLSTADEIRYRIKCRGVHQLSEIVVGHGVGECSTNEDKYKWRKAICEEEYNAMPENRRRIKWANGRNGVYTIRQVRTEAADLANTVLKMAKKRAQIDLTLTCTSASDVFQQDLEDLPPELLPDLDGETGKQTPGVAAGEKATQGKPSPERDLLVTILKGKAQEGWPTLQKAWAALSEEERQVVGAEFGKIKQLAEGVSAKK